MPTEELVGVPRGEDSPKGELLLTLPGNTTADVRLVWAPNYETPGGPPMRFVPSRGYIKWLADGGRRKPIAQYRGMLHGSCDGGVEGFTRTVGIWRGLGRPHTHQRNEAEKIVYAMEMPHDFAWAEDVPGLEGIETFGPTPDFLPPEQSVFVVYVDPTTDYLRYESPTWAISNPQEVRGVLTGWEWIPAVAEPPYGLWPVEHEERYMERIWPR